MRPADAETEEVGERLRGPPAKSGGGGAVDGPTFRPASAQEPHDVVADLLVDVEGDTVRARLAGILRRIAVPAREVDVVGIRRAAPLDRDALSASPLKPTSSM